MADGLDINLRSDNPEEGPDDRTFLQRAWASVWDVLTSWGPPLLVVLVIRSILIEPFQIPSGSMVPTLAIGDFIVVSKLSYGLRIPFTDIELADIDEPRRGDVVVFIHPPSVSKDPWCWARRIPRAVTFDLLPFIPGPGPCTQDYVKRLVGLPGDVVEVRDSVLYINGKEQPRTYLAPYAYVDNGCTEQPTRQFEERLDGVAHPVLQTTSYLRRYDNYGPYKVPEGHYFMMGDNRDNSADSREWGPVPRAYMKGRAKFVWLSFNTCEEGLPGLGRVRTERIGAGIH